MTYVSAAARAALRIYRQLQSAGRVAADCHRLDESCYITQLSLILQVKKAKKTGVASTMPERISSGGSPPSARRLRSSSRPSTFRSAPSAYCCNENRRITGTLCLAQSHVRTKAS